MMRSSAARVVWLLTTAVVVTLTSLNYVTAQVTLPESYKEQIRKSAANVTLIHNYMLSGAGRNQTFERLAWLGDSYGFRLTGTEELERVLDVIMDNLTAEGFDVHGENVSVPHWTRGEEYAELIEPRHYRMPILGLGGSVGTQPANGGNASCNCIIADAIVVNSFAHLDSLSNDTIQGKIVVYNVPWQGSYGPTVEYRSRGASEAAKRGAVAALIRSVTQYSIWSPHTGVQEVNVTIPGACIAVEDAEMLQRMYDRGLQIQIKLYMEAENHPETISRNVVAELKGSEFPNETIILGGHIDAWDTGTGSMDDGGGVMIAWQTLSALKTLGLTPRRTLRLVLWTAEEQGLIGGHAYYDANKAEVNNVSLIVESDAGAFKPRGIRFTGNTTAQLIMQEITNTMLNDINASAVIPGGESSDTGDWVNAGVPGMELYSYNEDYFFYHHTHGDTMTVLDRQDLDLCTTVWATVAYTVANLDTILPRLNCPDLGPTICTSQIASTTPSTVGGANAPGSYWLTLLLAAALGLLVARLNR